MKKEELKDKFPLAMSSQEKAQTWAERELESNSPVRTRPLNVWKKKEDDLLRGSRSFVSLQ